MSVLMDDGSEFEVQALNVDLIRWDRTRAQRQWPTAQDAPFLWMTFLAWAAGRRTNALADDVTFDDFADKRCQQVKALGTVPTDPTQLGPALA